MNCIYQLKIITVKEIHGMLKFQEIKKSDGFRGLPHWGWQAIGGKLGDRLNIFHCKIR